MASLPQKPDPSCVSMEKVWDTHTHLVTEKCGGSSRTGTRAVPWEQLWGTSNSDYGRGQTVNTKSVTTGDRQQVWKAGYNTTNQEYGKGVDKAAPARRVLNRSSVPQTDDTIACHPETQATRDAGERPSTHLPGQIATPAGDQKNTDCACSQEVAPYPPADFNGAQVGNLRLRTGPLPTPARQYMEDYCDRLMQNMTSLHA